MLHCTTTKANELGKVKLPVCTTAPPIANSPIVIAFHSPPISRASCLYLYPPTALTSPSNKGHLQLPWLPMTEHPSLELPRQLDQLNCPINKGLRVLFADDSHISLQARWP